MIAPWAVTEVLTAAVLASAASSIIGGTGPPITEFISAAYRSKLGQAEGTVQWPRALPPRLSQTPRPPAPAPPTGCAAAGSAAATAFAGYRLELRDNEIEALVRRGLLLASEQTNRAAVIKAMYAFFDRTLGRPT